MASTTHYHAYDPNKPAALKPLLLSAQHPHQSPMSSPDPTEMKHHYGQVNHNGQPSPDFEQMKRMRDDDISLKLRIRRLRVAQRVLSVLFSIAAFVPITMTMYKFMSTRHIFKDVTSNGKTVTRNAWALETSTWPTYMYFGVASGSLVLNSITLAFYLRGVTHANRANAVATAFTWAVILSNVIVWAVSTAFYKYGKDLHGKPNDLWGWSCSAAAQEIQDIFVKEVNFSRYCTVQSSSWYAGLAHVGAASFSGFIYFLVFRRYRSKREVRRMSTRLLSEFQ